MTKAEAIMRAHLEGKSAQEMIDAGISGLKFIQITLGKNNIDWKTGKLKGEPAPISNGTGYGKNPFIGVDPAEPGGDKTVEVTVNTETGEFSEVVDIDREMLKMEARKKMEVLAKTLAQLDEDVPEDLRDKNLEEQARNIAGTSKVRKVVEKCHRHPDQNVKPGDNCPLCIEYSKSTERLIQINNHAPPCPKCGKSEIFKMGINAGVIKIAKTVNGVRHYGCGNCSVTYNLKGECVKWEENLDGKYY